MKTIVFALGVMSLLVLPGLTSCSAVNPKPEPGVIPAGTVSYVYTDGKLQRQYQASLDTVWEAVVAAAGQLRLETKVEKRDQSTGILEGEIYDGTHIIVQVARRTSGSTLVEIQAGWVGDRVKSEFIHETIASKIQPRS